MPLSLSVGGERGNDGGELMAARRAVTAIAAKDILTWFRTPSAIVASLLPPVAFLLIIFVVAGAVGRNPVALVVEDNGPQAQRLVSVLEDSDAFRVRRTTPDDATHLLDTLQVAGVITVPASFDDDFRAHRPDPVSVRINNLNLDFTNDLRRSVPAAITEFYAGQAETPITVGVAELDLRPHDVDLVQFELVPILVLLLTIMGVVNGGLAAAREFEELTIKALLLSPISRATLIAGKILACWVTTMMVATLVLILSYAFGVLQPAGWYWLPAIAAIGLIALAGAGLGTALGGALRRFSAVAGAGINLSIYLFFLSGGIGVAAFLPAWIQAVAHFTPTFYGVDALEAAIFYQSTDNLGRDLTVLLATAAVGLGLGIVSLRRRLVAS
ncbi:ABC transporter permease [Arthrobacter sp. NyZ413]|uniref:ABC transporter permease n=1 Tax=Arthrobacter sp. NyZ413 TaxID=3144669 RepID=UPI003BF794DA